MLLEIFKKCEKIIQNKSKNYFKVEIDGIEYAISKAKDMLYVEQILVNNIKQPGEDVSVLCVLNIDIDSHYTNEYRCTEYINALVTDNDTGYNSDVYICVGSEADLNLLHFDTMYKSTSIEFKISDDDELNNALKFQLSTVYNNALFDFGIESALKYNKENKEILEYSKDHFLFSHFGIAFREDKDTLVIINQVLDAYENTRTN